MSSLYYLAFIIGFTTAAFNQIDKVQGDYNTYRSEIRDVSSATKEATCQRTLSSNFCSNWLK
jgi:hypothetical protein